MQKKITEINLKAIFELLYKVLKNNVYTGKCYQYTKLHVVDNLLSSGDLRATSMKFLNDTWEYDYASKILFDNNDTNIGDKYFSCSFTKKKDDIPQYLVYAGEIGVAVEYDFSYSSWERMENLPSIAINDVKDNIFDFGSICKPIEVKYLKNDKLQKILKDEIDYIKNVEENFDVNVDEINNIAKELIPCFSKNKGFKDEKEVRFAVPHYQILYNIEDSDEIKTYRAWENYPVKVHFMQAENKLIKPYVNLFFSINKNSKRKKVGLPISAIWIGPGRDQKRALKSVKMRLDYGDIKMFPLPISEYCKRLKLYYIYCLGWLSQEYKDIFESSTSWKDAIMTEEECLQEEKDNILNYENRVLKEFANTFKDLDNFYNSDIKENYIIGIDAEAPEYAETLKEKAFEFFKNYVVQIIKDVFSGNIINEMFEKSESLELKLSNVWCEKKFEEYMKEFDQLNYFSSTGIAVHCSLKGLSLV